MRDRIEDRSYYDLVASGFTIVPANLGCDVVAEGVLQVPTVLKRAEDETFWAGNRFVSTNPLQTVFVIHMNEAPRDWFRVVPTKDGSKWALATEEPPTG